MSLPRKFLTRSFYLLLSLLLTACQFGSSSEDSLMDVVDVVPAANVSGAEAVNTKSQATPNASLEMTTADIKSIAQSDGVGIEVVTTSSVIKRNAMQTWRIKAASKDLHFDGVFECKQVPFVGDFQECHLVLQQSGKMVDDASLVIDGGMKAHGHRLPTKPRIVAMGQRTGKYRIDGLKFSMSGDWTVGFLIRANGVADRLIFDFTI